MNNNITTTEAQQLLLTMKVNPSHANSLQNNNPELTRSILIMSVTAGNQKHNEDLRSVDPTTTYRGASVKYSEIH